MNKKYGIRIKWLAVSSFEIEFDGTTIVTDPFVTECMGTELTYENIEKCNIICLSHAHWDHITDIPRLVNKFSPKILCGDQTALPLVKWLDCNPTLLYPMQPNMELDFGDVKVRALFGKHSDQGKRFERLISDIKNNDICKADPRIADMQALGSMEYRNFLFTHKNGTKILMWGNDPTVEQINICKELKPDIAIIQRSNELEKSLQKADFAAQIGCKVVVPHHHDFYRVDPPEIIKNFKDEYLRIVKDGVFLTLKHGEWVEL